MPDSFILRDWQNFYMLAGTVSATLIGLLFVAISFGARLVNDRTESAVRAFVVPTVIHFGIVLSLSILAVIPTYTHLSLSAMLALIGGIGIAYIIRVLRQMKTHHRERQALHATHWLWHLLFPALSYLSIFGTAIGLLFGFSWLLGLLALAVTGLIVVGLRNAFDLMMWIAHQPG